MRIYLLALILLWAFHCPAQEILTASAEPQLYENINNALATGQVRSALHQFNEIVCALEKDGRTSELPERYFGMALALALNGNYPASIRMHRKAIRVHRRLRDDDPLEIKLNLGLTYWLAGKERKAKRILGRDFRTAGPA